LLEKYGVRFSTYRKQVLHLKTREYAKCFEYTYINFKNFKVFQKQTEFF
jgi:hypothetical protein